MFESSIGKDHLFNTRNQSTNSPFIFWPYLPILMSLSITITNGIEDNTNINAIIRCSIRAVLIPSAKMILFAPVRKSYGTAYKYPNQVKLCENTGKPVIVKKHKMNNMFMIPTLYTRESLNLLIIFIIPLLKLSLLNQILTLSKVK